MTAASEQGGKPTAGIWRKSRDCPSRQLHITTEETWICGQLLNDDHLMEAEEAEANADLIAEAGNVYHETGMTPRQLADHAKEAARLVSNAQEANKFAAEERDNLKQANAQLVTTLESISKSVHADSGSRKKAIAALAKHKPAEDARRGA